jgi:hypothetical protein
MQWCEQLPQPGQIADTAHAKLFETEFVRATNLSAFQSEVIDWLRALKEKQQKQKTAAVPSQPASPSGKKLIFVDDIATEPALDQRLRAILRGANCDIRSIPPKAPLGSNGIDVAELLRPCRAGITIFADRAKYTTVYNRLVFFLNRIAEAQLPLARWGVYLEQGTVASEFGIESDDVVPIDEHGLAEFLRML